jgi:dihydrofolate reductase
MGLVLLLYWQFSHTSKQLYDRKLSLSSSGIIVIGRKTYSFWNRKPHVKNQTTNCIFNTFQINMADTNANIRFDIYTLSYLLLYFTMVIE